jgi:uncharacterized phage infection (PIP) family protein YhgE
MEELDRKHEEKYETAIAEHRARVEAIEQTLSGAHAQHAQTKEEVSNCIQSDSNNHPCIHPLPPSDACSVHSHRRRHTFVHTHTHTHTHTHHSPLTTHHSLSHSLTRSRTRSRVALALSQLEAKHRAELEAAHAQHSQTKEELEAKSRAEMEEVAAKHRAELEENQRILEETQARLKAEAEQHAGRASEIAEKLAAAEAQSKSSKEELLERHRAENESHNKTLQEQVGHLSLATPTLLASRSRLPFAILRLGGFNCMRLFNA